MVEREWNDGERDEPKKCEADVDEEVGTAACNYEHADRWDYWLSVS